MASSSSECSDDDSNHSDYENHKTEVRSYPWNKPTKEDNRFGPGGNSFKNDGSFLEMFKKMQDSQTLNQNTKSGSSADDCVSGSSSAVSIKSEPDVDPKSNSTSDEKTNKTVNRFVGKRRVARVLPTGLVKKQRKDADNCSKDPGPKASKNDPWSKYMDEVRKYKQQSCSEEEGSRRPLVK